MFQQTAFYQTLRGDRALRRENSIKVIFLSNKGTAKTQGCVFLRGKNTISSQGYPSWFIYPAGADHYSWISSGKEVADSVEMTGGFLGPLQYYNINYVYVGGE